MAYKTTISPKLNAAGKSELLVRYDISRDNRPRFKTGIFVTPSIFIDGYIYTDDNALKGEALKADRDFKAFIARVSNIVHVTTEAKAKGRFDGILDKNWIERVLRLKGVDLSEASFNEIQDAISDEEKARRRAEEAERMEAERKAEEESRRNRKTLFDYIFEYCESEGISEHRTRMYAVMARTLVRYELYRQMVKRDGFALDYDTLTNADIDDFKHFLLHEADIKAGRERVFEKIETIAAERVPVLRRNYVLQTTNRGTNYFVDMAKKLKAVFRWLRTKGITTNDPFSGVPKGHWGRESYGVPFYLTAAERDRIANFDLSDKPALAVQRDIMIFQCLCGARYGDLSRLTQANIIGEILEYRPAKTRREADQVQPRVPLNSTARQILEKYKNVDKHGRILPFVSEQKYNDALKKILVACGIDRIVVVRDATTGDERKVSIAEVFSSHACRRTFIGTLYHKTRDVEVISSMSGHAPGSRSFARYRAICDDDRKSLIEQL